MLQGSSSRVRWVPSLTQALRTQGQSEPLPRCGAAAESCICSGNSIQPCCPPWRALWIRWCGLERTGMRRWEELGPGFACLMLLLSGCLSGSDGGKNKTLVVRLHMSLHMCESKLDVGFLHECLTTWLPRQTLFGPVSMCINTSILSCCFDFWDFFFANVSSLSIALILQIQFFIKPICISFLCGYDYQS